MEMRKWRTEDSAELYNFKGWGVDYFGINDKGHVYVAPNKSGQQIDIKEVVDELQARDVATPILLRFPDILNNRIEHMADCFKKAAEEYEYKGKYFTVYPIKVNQMEPVVREIITHGKKYNIGLEAGSKPELHAVLAFTENSETVIVCNGYKDEDFIELALLSEKMGKHVFIVVEKLNELKLIIDTARRLDVAPNIGIRIKLASSGSGKWESSGGDESKFGLNASELLEAVEIAREEDMLDRIRMIHFHLGSQITNIRKIKNALREASHFYVQLKKMGCGVDFFDIGGGLGIDYDGSRSSRASSVNYMIQEYANDTIANIVDACDKNDLPHPHIITESGRSLTAHHSILVFDVLATTTLPSWDDEYVVGEDDHELIQELHGIYEKTTHSGTFEDWHDALQIREEALDLFGHGIIDLHTRAMAERLFWSIAREIHSLSKELKHPPLELPRLTRMLSEKYFCNFSLFQSLPDSWAIDQIFPITPIHRLEEKPEVWATIQDITCDSDGKIDRFVGSRELKYYLPLHKYNPDKPYYLAAFLIGAYQEILGDMHNLFGDTNTVHINLTDAGYEIQEVIDGETVAEVLSYVQYNSKKLVRIMEKWVSTSIKDGKISQKEGKEFLSNYRSGLYGYTYLEKS
jgi:arginine decarboxylase